MILLVFLAAMLFGGYYEGNYSQTFFADAGVNVFAVNSTFDNCTGKVVASGNLSIFSRFKGEIWAENAQIFIKDSEVNLTCINSTVTAIKNKLNVTLKNCTLRASLNEITAVSIDEIGDFSSVWALPVIYRYNNTDFWNFVGNWWPGQELELVDEDGDGLSDFSVCPKIEVLSDYFYPWVSFCEHTLVKPPDNYEWRAIKSPPSIVYPGLDSEPGQDGLEEPEQSPEGPEQKPIIEDSLIRVVVATLVAVALCAGILLHLKRRL
ncbi:MAG: hypothetical protein QW532_00095 [Archaeoglobaceae archaeon]